MLESQFFTASPDLLFLDSTWGNSTHCHQLGTICQKKFISIPVTGVTQALAIAKGKSPTTDVYFAPAAFQTNLNRTSVNATGACCFWADIDVGAEKALNAKGYATLEKAHAAIASFCTAAAIPMPTHVVSTGGGFHIYWVVDKFVGKKLWKHLAQQLKDLARSLNFLADPSRTSDIASLMRLPGTLNHKYVPARPVLLLSAANEPINLCVFADAITAAHDRLIDSVSKPSGCSIGKSSCSRSKLDLLEVILKHVDPDCNYDDWFIVGAVIFNETGGSEAGYTLYDEWSCQGHKYRGQKETKRKWGSMNPNHHHPVRIGSLKAIVETCGHDWQQIICIAEFDCAEGMEVSE